MTFTLTVITINGKHKTPSHMGDKRVAYCFQQALSIGSMRVCCKLVLKIKLKSI